MHRQRDDYAAVCDSARCCHRALWCCADLLEASNASRGVWPRRRGGVCHVSDSISDLIHKHRNISCRSVRLSLILCIYPSLPLRTCICSSPTLFRCHTHTHPHARWERWPPSTRLKDGQFPESRLCDVSTVNSDEQLCSLTLFARALS